eukprot:359622-Chlamydomonas_euryale.AAC.19
MHARPQQGPLALPVACRSGKAVSGVGTEPNMPATCTAAHKGLQQLNGSHPVSRHVGPITGNTQYVGGT